MTSYASGFVRTFVSGAVLSAYQHVKLVSGNVVPAGAGETGIGFTVTAVAEAGDPVGVQIGRPTVIAIAAGTVAAGATVYAAASGKVSTTVSGDPIGLALTAAGADGDTIELLPYIP